jgi:hypothetical protein
MKQLLLFLFLPFPKEIPYRTLSWSDFKGKSDNSTTIARSYTGIVIEKDTVFAYFDSERSWTRTNDSATLRHEQLHFTITQWYANDMFKSMKVGATDYDYDIRAWGNLEKRYDEETDHGRNLEAQKKWEQKIKL